ncbi:PA14 domain-containing protein [Planctomycetota bacterium]
MNKRFAVLVVIGLLLLCNVASAKIMSKWAKDVTPDNVWPEYPRPQMVRKDWMNLNGQWEYAIRPKEWKQPSVFDGDILVPFCIESALSGVQKEVGRNNRLWYRRSFDMPENWSGKQILLHFGAVDWETTVWVNGKKIGTHKGGYDPFSFDINDALNNSGPEEIVLSVWDPINEGTQPHGKQVKEPGGIWYTSVTGIWQTVWLEPVNDTYIESLRIVPDVDSKLVRIRTECSGVCENLVVETEVKAGNITEFKGKVRAGDTLAIYIENPKLWSPDSPFLYDLKVTLTDDQGKKVDEVGSYFGMRKISLGKDENGITRMMLNNEFVFQFGFLDQGWWPDGLYTAPTDEALKYDVEVTKKLGFNLARKHVKREPARWYYWCDKLGLLVWQDMPSGDRFIDPVDGEVERSEESAEQFMLELKRMIDNLYNHPSIVVWVPYNEGWGQWATEKVTKMLKEQDPSRLINSASGWADRGVGDILDIHSYPGPDMPEPETKRAIVLGEFGGLGLPIEGHTWQDKENWGYRNFKNSSELTDAYRKLIKDLHPMIGRGLSAAVYTQTTDVEVEVNGMMTYDRAVIKMDVEELRRINRGYLPPIIESEDEIFIDSAKVKIFNAVQEGQIRYALDNSGPDKESKLYTKPLTLTQTTTVKARTFWPDGTKSAVSEYTCKKVNLREAKKVTGLKPGLKVEYFEASRIWDELPDFSELKADASEISDKCDLSFAKREENFALKFVGYIKVPENGIYTFYSNSDDGSRLYINSTEVVNNDYSHPMTEKSGMIALKAGVYTFKLTFYQGMGGKGLEVGFEGPGIEKQQIPANVLFHK